MAFSLNPDDYTDATDEPKGAAQAAGEPELADVASIMDEARRATAPDDAFERKAEAATDPQTKAIMSVDLADLAQRDEITRAVRDLGARGLKDAQSGSNSLLDATLGELGSGDSNTQSVGNSLAELSHTLEDLNPRGVDFYKKGVLGKLTLKARRYLERYETSSKKIDEIAKTLKRGASQLEADAKTLEIESVSLTKASRQLAEDAEVATRLSTSLQAECDRRKADPSPEMQARVKWVEQEVLFPLASRRQALEAQLAATQQAIVAYDVARRNDLTLAQTVRDTSDMSIQLMRTGVMLATALQTQRQVTEQVKAVRDANSRMIRQNAAMLGETGRDVQELATGAIVDPGALEEAYDACIKAVEDADTFRSKAIPQMQAQSERFHELYLKSRELTDRMQGRSDEA